MTMHIVFQKDFDGFKNKQECYVERALARRFCRNGVAITYQQHIDNIYDAEQAEKAAREKKKEDKKAELFKKKHLPKINASSKKIKETSIK